MIISLSDLLDGIRRRKITLGIVDTEERTDAMRNDGSRRMPGKRAMLARMEKRALAAGVTAGSLLEQGEWTFLVFGSPID